MTKNKTRNWNIWFITWIHYWHLTHESDLKWAVLAWASKETPSNHPKQNPMPYKPPRTGKVVRPTPTSWQAQASTIHLFLRKIWSFLKELNSSLSTKSHWRKILYIPFISSCFLSISFGVLVLMSINIWTHKHLRCMFPEAAVSLQKQPAEHLYNHFTANHNSLSWLPSRPLGQHTCVHNAWC